MAKVASRAEVQEYWSIDDLADANDAMDASLEAERVAQERANAKQRR